MQSLASTGLELTQILHLQFDLPRTILTLRKGHSKPIKIKNNNNTGKLQVNKEGNWFLMPNQP